jgi:hypothetical protein
LFKRINLGLYDGARHTGALGRDAECLRLQHINEGKPPMVHEKSLKIS